jgi:hypothetical protein
VSAACPRRSPRLPAQRLEPGEHKAAYGGDFAIASLNRHHDHAGDVFRLSGAAGPHPACLALGLERRLHAISDRHGKDPASRPSSEQVAERVAEQVVEKGRTVL